LFIFLFLSQSSKGQDVCSQNPKYCKVLSDTSGIKMMLITLPAGAKLAKHTHALNIGYVIQGGLFSKPMTMAARRLEPETRSLISCGTGCTTARGMR
jgi:hypothetical protein